MPTVPIGRQLHRDRVPDVERHLNPFAACVARKVPRKEWSNPKAKAALDKEWNKLKFHAHPTGKGVGVWDEKGVREARNVRSEARESGKPVHFGRVVN